MDNGINMFTIDDLSVALQDLGCRAERFTDDTGGPVLRSASGGVSFSVRPGNPAEGGYFDFTIFSVLRTEAAFPLTLVNDWNASKRFARLHSHGDLLILEMDVVPAGRVSRDNLHVPFEIWTHLVNELLLFLRSASASSDRASGAGDTRKSA